MFGRYRTTVEENILEASKDLASRWIVTYQKDDDPKNTSELQ